MKYSIGIQSFNQIREDGYVYIDAKPYAADKRQVICIGANFSSSTRTVEEWEERWLS